MTQPNPNIMHNTTHNNNEEAQTNKLCQQRLHSWSPIHQHWTLMMQTLSGKYSLAWLMMTINHCKRIFHSPAEEEQDAPPFFSTWEYSGSCYCCIAGGCKHKAHLSFNTDMKPTIQQLFKMFFFKPYVVGIIIPQTNICLQEEKHHPVSYGEFLHWLGLWFFMATINRPEHTDFQSMGEVDCFIGAPMRLGTGDCDSWKGTMEEVPFCSMYML